MWLDGREGGAAPAHGVQTPCSLDPVGRSNRGARSDVQYKATLHAHLQSLPWRRAGRRQVNAAARPCGYVWSGCRAGAANAPPAPHTQRGGSWASKYGCEAFALAWQLARHEALVLEAPAGEGAAMSNLIVSKCPGRPRSRSALVRDGTQLIDHLAQAHTPHKGGGED